MRYQHLNNTNKLLLYFLSSFQNNGLGLQNNPRIISQLTCSPPQKCIVHLGSTAFHSFPFVKWQIQTKINVENNVIYFSLFIVTKGVVSLLSSVLTARLYPNNCSTFSKCINFFLPPSCLQNNPSHLH